MVHAEKETNDRIQGIIPSENLQFDLRVLYDDLIVCAGMIDRLIESNRVVVFRPEQLPIPSEY